VIYLAVALIAGFMFLKKSYKAKREPTEKQFRGLFGYSILYLFALFFTIIIERSIQHWFLN
jgi:heme O synthase-like polyprenyltransferase